MRIFASMCCVLWYIAKNNAHEATVNAQEHPTSCRPISTSRPDAALADLGVPPAPADFAAIAAACARGRDDLAAAGSDEEGRKTPAPVLHLGDHPLSDPGRHRRISAAC